MHPVCVLTTLLHQAAAQGDADIVASFIKAGADVEARDAAGNTALHIAVEAGYERTIWALHSVGRADMGAKNHAGLSPLGIGYMMLQGQPDESKVRAVVTALQLALQNQHKDVVEMLINRKANYLVLDMLFYTAAVPQTGQLGFHSRDVWSSYPAHPHSESPQRGCLGIWSSLLQGFFSFAARTNHRGTGCKSACSYPKRMPFIAN